MATKAFKEQKINHIKENVEKAKVAIVTNYKGLSVDEITELRRALQKEGADYTVTKNTLAKIAFKGTQYEVLSDVMKESTAVAFGFNDEVSPAKVLAKFIKDKKKCEIIAGALDGQLLNASEVEALAKERVYEIMKPYVKVRKSTLNEDSGLIGAAYLAFSKAE